jgi:hypothetical protein
MRESRLHDVTPNISAEFRVNKVIVQFDGWIAMIALGEPFAIARQATDYSRHGETEPPTRCKEELSRAMLKIREAVVAG